MMSFSEYENAN